MSYEIVRKIPALFLSHGGGPCFFMDEPNDPFFSAIDRNSDAAKWYKQVAKQVKITNPPENVNDKHLWQKPKAIVIISAHWETKDTFLVTNQYNHKELLFDYYDFPPHTYKLKYPAPGYPELAKKIVELATNAGIKCDFDNKRNFDHGVFIPLLLVYPNADIPIVEVSVNANLDPKLHIEFGKALAPLREMGVLLIGSGQTTHGRFNSNKDSLIFVDALVDTLVNKTPKERLEILLNWEKLPFARNAHGKEEHLIPLHVIVGAIGNDKGHLLNNHMAGDMALHSFSFSSDF